MKIVLYVISLCILQACSFGADRDMEDVLTFAGDNRVELEKVLAHYKNDSLKLEAARFLILNMPGHGTYGGKNIGSFYAKLDSLLPFGRDVGKCKEAVNRLINESNVTMGLEWQEDVHTIKADFLINNIDRAFEVWQNEPFARHILFEDFCEYILPYRIKNEPLEYWRDSIIPYYNKIKHAGYCGGSEYSTFWASVELNNMLRDEYWPVLDNDNWKVTRKYSLMKKMPYGKCYDYAVQATFIMRAKGIPIVIDFTPQWPFRSLGHTWNVIKVNTGKNNIFGGILEGNNGQSNKPDIKMAKVYRLTYAINKESVAYKRKDEPIPAQLASPFFKDVSFEYFNGTDVVVPIKFNPSEKRQFVYLCIFNNHDWVPVTYAEQKRKKALFTEMGRDVMYLPAFYAGATTLTPANYPFLIDIRGNIHFYEPDMHNLHTLKLERKYPFDDGQKSSSQRMVGGEIQASDHPDFKDAQTFYVVTENPMGKYVRSKINPERKAFRYWRYFSPDQSSGNIAELEFYKNDTLYNKKGTIIGTTGSFDNIPDRTREYAFDNTPLTFFDAPVQNGAWVGMDFKTKVTIDEIGYIPRSDDNNVSPGDTYELFYYGKTGWVSLGRKVATDYSVTYDSVPGNALLWLRDLTKGQEERVFTYERDKQVWW